MTLSLRKEMKKWRGVMWVVFVAMALGSTITFVGRSSRNADMKIGSINNKSIPTKSFHRSYQGLSLQFQQLKQMAATYGFSADMFLQNILGDASSLEEAAWNNLVKETLTDVIISDLKISISRDVMRDELIKALPKSLIDESGNVDIDTYKNFVRSMGMTPGEFEEQKSAELKRALVRDLLNNAYYAPHYVAQQDSEQERATKSFCIAQLSYETLKKEAAAQEVTDEELRQYYDKNRDTYNVPEKKKVSYWNITPKMYESTIVLSEDALREYYEKHKAADYRIPPKVQVRRIFVAMGATPDAKEEARKKTLDLLAQVQRDPTCFAQLAKENFDNKDEAKQGGLMPLFGRGVHDPALEKAAFRLQEKGEVSDVVETKKGFVILQLAERVASTEKPYAEVRESVEKTLKQKRAVEELRADLDKLMHNAREDKDMVGTWAASKGLGQAKTLVADAQTSPINPVEKNIKEQLFGTDKKKQKVGYAAFKDAYAIYTLVEQQPASILPFEEVRGRVREAVLAQRADGIANEIIQAVKKDVLFGHQLLAEAAGGKQFKIRTTPLVDKDGAGKEFGDLKNIAKKAFELSANTQLLQSTQGKDHVLIQMVNSNLAPASVSGKDTQTPLSMPKNLSGGKANYSGLFIASLQRNAKIEIDETLLQGLGDRL